MSKPKVSSSQLEKVLGCGFYQFFVFVNYQFIVFLQCWNMTFMSFGKVVPNSWTCADVFENFTSGNSTHYAVSAGYAFSGNASNNASSSCASFLNETCKKYIWETDFYSIVPEWHLVCNKSYIIYTIISMQMFGVLIGSAIYGLLSDAFGRKWTLLSAVLMLMTTGVLSIFSTSWQIYLAFRFFIGLFCGGTINVSYVFLTESIQSKHRLWITTIAGWPPAFALLALLAYVTKDWRRLAVVISSVGAPALLTILVLPESPRWLMQKQKLRGAESSLLCVTRWNCMTKTMPTATVKEIVADSQAATHPLRPHTHTRKSYTLWHLCYTRKFTQHILVLIFAYLTVSMITYGVLMNNDKLMGDKYMNFSVFAMIRWVASVLTPVVDYFFKCCGRKLISAVSFGIIAATSGAVCLLMTSVSDLSSVSILLTGLVLAANTLTSPIWASLNLTSVEAFPTPIRNTAVGVCGVFTRLGGVIVPFFLYMAEWWQPSPYALFAVLSVISTFLCAFLLPETKNKPLPDVMPKQRQNCFGNCLKKRHVRKSRDHSPSSITERSHSFTVYKFVD